MSNVSAHLDSVDEPLLTGPEPPDRLPAMLFLAALIHGVLILGVTFNPELLDSARNVISLEVTIVAEPDQQIDRPEDARYLAQASQQGGGNTTDELRPSAPLESSSPFANASRKPGNDLVEAMQHESAADEVVSTSRDTKRQLVTMPRELPEPDTRRATPLEAGIEATLPLPEDDTATLRISIDDPDPLFVSADTRESRVAGYLDNWKRRIEAVGNAYFPELGDLEGLTGSPTLEVSIDASGQLRDVFIRKSSGSAVLDQAALDILYRASPFDPFPPDIRAEHDSLRFAYKWLFSPRSVPSSAQLE